MPGSPRPGLNLGSGLLATCLASLGHLRGNSQSARNGQWIKGRNSHNSCPVDIWPNFARRNQHATVQNQSAHNLPLAIARHLVSWKTRQAHQTPSPQWNLVCIPCSEIAFAVRSRQTPRHAKQRRNSRVQLSNSCVNKHAQYGLHSPFRGGAGSRKVQLQACRLSLSEDNVPTSTTIAFSSLAWR